MHSTTTVCIPNGSWHPTPSSTVSATPSLSSSFVTPPQSAHAPSKGTSTHSMANWHYAHTPPSPSILADPSPTTFSQFKLNAPCILLTFWILILYSLQTLMPPASHPVSENIPPTSALSQLKDYSNYVEVNINELLPPLRSWSPPSLKCRHDDGLGKWDHLMVVKMTCLADSDEISLKCIRRQILSHQAWTKHAEICQLANLDQSPLLNVCIPNNLMLRSKVSIKPPTRGDTHQDIILRIYQLSIDSHSWHSIFIWTYSSLQKNEVWWSRGAYFTGRFYTTNSDKLL